ncbi:MAG: hypothetical protein ACTHWO_11460 [Nesterenkonia sp.]
MASRLPVWDFSSGRYGLGPGASPLNIRFTGPHRHHYWPPRAISLAPGRNIGWPPNLRILTKQWRTVYHFSWKRYYRDQQNLNKQIFRAQDIAAGKRAIAKARFVTIQGKDIGINEADIERAKKLLGIKGYVTSAAEQLLSNEEVVAHYHALFEVGLCQGS